MVDDGTLSNTSITGLSYKILDQNGNIIVESVEGIYDVEKRGRVVVDSGSGIDNIQTYFAFSQNNYFYFDSSLAQYYIDGYPEVDNQFYIDGYDGGDQAGISGKVLQRLVSAPLGSQASSGRGPALDRRNQTKSSSHRRQVAVALDPAM